MNSQKYPYYLRSIFNLLTKFQDPKLILSIFLGRYSQETAQIQLKENGLQFTVRGAMDVWSIKETFIDRFYERFGTPIQDGWTVVDVGAGLGDFTIFAACKHPSNHVIAYEPFDESFSLLGENLRLNDVDKVLVFQCAVAGQSGQIALDLSGGEALQITSKELKTNKKMAGEATLVPSLSLADLISVNKLTKIDLIKLDCEGAEYDILFNAEDDTLTRIDRIVMEYHDGVSSHDYNELAQFLQERGYHITITSNFVHDHLGYMYASRV